jgi:hypothetical protein
MEQIPMSTDAGPAFNAEGPPDTGHSFDDLRAPAAPTETPEAAADSAAKEHPAAETSPSTPTEASASSSAVSRENFQREMTWERHGYRPTAYFNTIEEARSPHHDLQRTEAYVSVKHGGFTAEELAAIPSNAKQTNYYIGFAKQMLDSNEGIFTKKFWTSFEGIKKVFTAGIIKGEVEQVRLEAAEWIMTKRGGASPEASTAAEAAPPIETSPTPETRLTQDATMPPENAQEPAVSDKDKRVVETKTLDTAALQDIDKRIQEKLGSLRDRIIPETITIRIDDPKSAQLIRQLQRYSEGFNAGFAGQISKVHEALDTIGKLGLDQPQQGIVFKKKQEQALGLIDALSFGQSDLEKMAKEIKVPRGDKLPDSMKEAMAHSNDILEGIKSDLDEARRLIATARRINPTAKAEQDVVAQQSAEPKVELRTGSVAAMPRLGKELTIEPQKLEMISHAMVDAAFSDRDLKTWYKMVMSEFLKSQVKTYSDIRREIYAARTDGEGLNELQKIKLGYLTSELARERKPSDLLQLDYSKLSIPGVAEIDPTFKKIVDDSEFGDQFKKMRSEFAAALRKEIEKVPGTEDTDTTYVAFKRHKFERSGITDYLAKH